MRPARALVISRGVAAKQGPRRRPLIVPPCGQPHPLPSGGRSAVVHIAHIPQFFSIIKWTLAALDPIDRGLFSYPAV